jgi:hypothetical protein
LEYPLDVFELTKTDSTGLEGYLAGREDAFTLFTLLQHKVVII